MQSMTLKNLLFIRRGFSNTADIFFVLSTMVIGIYGSHSYWSKQIQRPPKPSFWNTSDSLISLVCSFADVPNSK
jgi:hypothetical protein